MGQRAYRSRITDSIIKNYLGEDSASKNEGLAGTSTCTSSIDDYYFQGKLIDLNLEFNVDSPLSDISDINTALSKGLINSLLPKGAKIKNLNLVLTSSLFGEGLNHLHSNLYILFGSYFYRDIKYIYIRLLNPISKKTFNERKIISKILEFMCFKTIKCIRINSSLLYYVIPEYSEFAIVVAYKDINFYEKIHFNFLNCIEDLLFHTYCLFERKTENFNRCLRAIEKTVPKEVNNIILPVVSFKIEISHREISFPDLSSFIKEISNRFKIMSIELKVEFEAAAAEIDNTGEKRNLQYFNFLETVIKENYETLSKFTYSYISFDFSTETDLISKTNSNYCSEPLLGYFRKIIHSHRLLNLTLANHITYELENKIHNSLHDSFDFYDYIYYDIEYFEKICYTSFAFKKSNIIKRIYNKKAILENLLKYIFSFKKIYRSGRINYSSEVVKNKKIVPMALGQNNVMVFTN